MRAIRASIAAAAGAASRRRCRHVQSYAPGAPLPPIGGDDQASMVRRLRRAAATGTSAGHAGHLADERSGPHACGRRHARPPAASAWRRPVRQRHEPAGRAQYAEASAAFRAYADANPDDTDLSPQAIYWVGNIAYVQQDYPGAARAFAEQIKKYPKSPRAPDSYAEAGPVA